MSETPIAYAGCPWPLDLGCIDEEAWAAFPEGVQVYATALASSALYQLSGRRVGGCPITVRPCAGRVCAPVDLLASAGGLAYPGITLAGTWVNNCGCATSQCGHPRDRSVQLPPPIGRVDSIKVDGVDQPLSEFRIDDGMVLVYQGDDPDFVFPATQDLRLRDTEPGTWSVTYLNAYAPDLLAARAVTHLAYEFALSCVGGAAANDCRLPASVRTVVRMGVTMEMNVGVFPEGFTTIPEVDAWISLVNPYQRKSPTRVYSLDLEPPVIQGPTLISGPAPSGGMLP